jgi:hypothetical protein
MIYSRFVDLSYQADYPFSIISFPDILYLYNGYVYHQIYINNYLEKTMELKQVKISKLSINYTFINKSLSGNCYLIKSSSAKFTFFEQ